MNIATQTLNFSVNGKPVTVHAQPITRLADVLRLELGLTGTKVGCNAGDCGACTVLLDGEQICACMVPAGQVAGREITTVEGLATEDGTMSVLQDAFQRNGAAQCGICTPGMLMAARDLLDRVAEPTEQETLDALGGVLCRCTGYRKIVEAILDVANGRQVPATPAAEKAVGARIAKVDGAAKLTGIETFGADRAPADALWLRAVRSPYPSARFSVGDLETFQAEHPGLTAILTWRDVPGNNAYGIYPVGKDQPVLAREIVRYRGEAVLALVGDLATVDSIRDEDLPIEWHPDDGLIDMADAVAPDAPPMHDNIPDNVLTRGYVKKGDVEEGFDVAAFTAHGAWQTGYVEHAYIEPEAGWAQRVGDRLEVTVSTQTPYMDRDEIAHVMGLEKEQVRVIPTACGGGFGGKLDMSVHPLVAVAAWKLERPVRMVYTRPESMAASTKRHPSEIFARAGCDTDGHLTAFEFTGDFNTGAYASWGPTVADRVPVHATGPYYVPHVLNQSRAIHTNGPPSGAFRGFGVPQAAIAHEALYDDLAKQAGIDRLEFRLINAIRTGQATATGQVLNASAGLAQCLEALKPAWAEALADAESFNAGSAAIKQGVGIGCMWYGCGNTSMSNPSTMLLGLAPDGRLTLYNGAADIGQGSNTIMIQIAADGLGVPADSLGYIMGDTDLTPDAGKSSASRQTFVSGRAAQMAGENLRQQILRLANASTDATLDISDGAVRVVEGDVRREIDLAALTPDHRGNVLTGEGTFDPPTEPLDENGQGVPYATYGFAAQLAVVHVDLGLGTTKVRHIVAAHDVGRAVNPTQVEGQVHGGIAQGLGLALMEEYIPGKTEDLHNYLIPTIGDVPPIDVLIVEDPEPLGPFGAKGIGEPALIPTAPAIFGAIKHATGVAMTRAPATPDRVYATLKAAGVAL